MYYTGRHNFSNTSITTNTKAKFLLLLLIFQQLAEHPGTNNSEILLRNWSQQHMNKHLI